MRFKHRRNSQEGSQRHALHASISFGEPLAKNPQVMDGAALQLCRVTKSCRSAAVPAFCRRLALKLPVDKE